MPVIKGATPKKDISKIEIGYDELQSVEPLLKQFDLDSIRYIFSKVFQSEIHAPEAPPQRIDKIHYPKETIDKAIEILKEGSYEGTNIILEETGKPYKVNPLVIDTILAKHQKGGSLGCIEVLILSTGAYLSGNYFGNTQFLQESTQEAELSQESKSNIQEKMEQTKNIQKSLDTFTETDTRVNPTLWYRDKNGNRLIDGVIDETIEANVIKLRSKFKGDNDQIKKFENMAEEVKKAIYELMKRLEQERKYKPFSYEKASNIEEGKRFVSFEDKSNFNKLLKEYEVGKQFGGLIYLIQVKGEFYVGLTERTIEDRFEQHLIDSIYISTEDDITVAGETYGELHRAIAYVLKSEEVGYDIEKLEKELRFYSSTYRYGERRAKLTGIMEKIKPFIKTNIIEIHHDSKKLGQREKMYTKKLPIQKLVEMGIISRNNKYSGYETLDTKENGLNMVYGGAVGAGTSLPAYDLAIMTAMGMLSGEIGIYMQEKYGLIDKDAGDNRRKRIVQHRIYEDLHGSYQGQEELLKPIMEHLDNFNEFSRHNIYQFFRKAEFSAFGWFLDWSDGKKFLQNDIIDLCQKNSIDQDA
ncbi:MAG: hypothetical protein GF311_27665, partial [Candidatus Lokiarchaeota archaeon]|nr:hypothetical protein [Candidatus Lokiarchaeota archaeon]